MLEQTIELIAENLTKESIAWLCDISPIQEITSDIETFYICGNTKDIQNEDASRMLASLMTNQILLKVEKGQEILFLSPCLYTSGELIFSQVVTYKNMVFRFTKGRPLSTSPEDCDVFIFETIFKIQ
jgi:hypothetical protein